MAYRQTLLLTRKKLGFSSFSTIIKTPIAGKKVLESFSEEFEIGSHKIVLETGKMARFANGAVIFGIEETKVLSTVASSVGDGSRDFLPLTLCYISGDGKKLLETFSEESEVGSHKIVLETGKMDGSVVLGIEELKVLSTVADGGRGFLTLPVDYQEKQFAQGVIPNTFMRREGAPKERELLCGRLIDRPIRPLFPSGFYHDVQVTASVLSSDGKQDPDIMAANATSAALMLSDIPWGGPIGVIRIGRIAGKFVVNPTMDELNLSDLNLVYACTKDKTLMLDVQARGISERDLEAAFRLAHPEAVKFIEPQIRLAAKAGKKKKEYTLSLVSKRTMDKIRNSTAAPIEAVFTDPTYGKFERGEALDKIMKVVKKELEEEGDEESLKNLPKTVDTVRKEVVRKRIISEGLRVDGRCLDEVRPLYSEAGNLPQLHGSSLFSRGDTQVLCTVTLGAPGQAQRLESPVGPPTKRFMLHYSFPPFCINEVGKRTGLNRREVGHGTLAEKALLAVIPPENDLRYTIRINSEVMASDGSTSMATVCGGSMALMDAGIPLKEHVAGVSVGLVSDVDPSTGDIKDYRIVTDILGLEDHLGDMDFKIAGTRNGITAIQLDIKPAGIPLDIICESLEPALKARLQILDHMDQEISAPRVKDEMNSPRIVTLKYSNEAIRKLVGPLGALKRKIEEDTGAKISVSDGSLTVVAKNNPMLEKVLERVDFIIGREIEVGGIYKGTVMSIKEYGAFVEFNGGQAGLLHISELSHEPVTRVADMVSIGQTLSLKCIGQDIRGNIKLSLKVAQPQHRPVEKDIEEPSVHIEKSSINFQLKKLKLHTARKDFPWSSKDDTGESSSLPSSSPSIIIRSASECDDHTPTMKVKLHTTVKDFPESKDEMDESESPSSSSSILIRSASECDEEEKSAKLIHKKAKKLKKLQSECDDTKLPKNPINTKNLKLGSKVTAKVHQVRTRGLVLDLGGGIHGMYRFEAGAKKEFEVGDKLVVECSSFSGKGVPVMSIVEDGQ